MANAGGPGAARAGSLVARAPPRRPAGGKQFKYRGDRSCHPFPAVDASAIQAALHALSGGDRKSLGAASLDKPVFAA
jgi:hypothetical protein